jgi:(E)-4-hydroxy-3-methylbut-2-enyl-diphosphate synthase
MKRRATNQVQINHKLWIGSDYPIVLQSMTNTATTDIRASVEQIIKLYEAGSSLVRLTIKDEDSAKAVPEIVSALDAQGLDIPLVGDFHYNGHLLLAKYPQCAAALAKYRINPGNVGYGDKHDYNFKTIIQIAKANDKAVRIGVNWGSLDQELLTEFMTANAQSSQPLGFKEVVYKAMIESALRSMTEAISSGFPENKIILSVKMSEVEDLINVYRAVASLTKAPLHLGLTEAGTPIKGMIASSAALGILLHEGIGDTIRMSLTPGVGEGVLAERSLEIRACQELLQALGLAYYKPSVTSCPGCGRTSSNYFQQLAEDINKHISEQINTWKINYPGVEQLKIAVMGCIVNGPGESKYADIGISLPGDNEDPVAPVFVDGKLHTTLRGDNISNEFKTILDNYIQERFAVTV